MNKNNEFKTYTLFEDTDIPPIDPPIPPEPPKPYLPVFQREKSYLAVSVNPDDSTKNLHAQLQYSITYDSDAKEYTDWKSIITVKNPQFLSKKDENRCNNISTELYLW